MGFVKAKSNASLLAGGIAGALLIVAGYVLGRRTRGRGRSSGSSCLSRSGRFVPSFLKTRKAMPAGMMAALSVVGVGLTVALLALG